MEKRMNNALRRPLIIKMPFPLYLRASRCTHSGFRCNCCHYLIWCDYVRLRDGGTRCTTSFPERNTEFDFKFKLMCRCLGAWRRHAIPFEMMRCPNCEFSLYKLNCCSRQWPAVVKRATRKSGWETHAELQWKSGSNGKEKTFFFLLLNEGVCVALMRKPHTQLNLYNKMK